MRTPHGVVRLVAQIAADEPLGAELALRGGAALHVLHLDEPLRACARLAYARTTRTAIGPVFDALREVADTVGWELGRREVSHDLAHLWLHGPRSVLRLTMNTRETDPCRPRVRLPVSGGDVRVLTFTVEEVAATKLRAFHQRRAPRDAFDLLVALQVAGADPGEVAACFRHYVEPSEIAAADLVATVGSREEDTRYLDGLHRLLDDAGLDLTPGHALAHLRGALTARM